MSQVNLNQKNHDEDHGVLKSLANVNQTTFEQSPQSTEKKEDEKEQIGQERSNPKFRFFY